jgi:protein-arginine kinase
MLSEQNHEIEELIIQRDVASKNGDGALVMNLKDEIAVAVNQRDFLAKVKQPDR